MSNFETQRILHCIWAKNAFLNFVVSECSPEEVSNIQHISDSWNNSRDKFLELSKHTKFICKAIEVRNIPKEYNSRIEEARNNPAFKSAFNHAPVEFKIVEIDKMVASQNMINLTHADTLMKTFPKKLDFDAVFDICLNMDKEVPKTSEIFTQKHAIYTSANTDLRFLGSVPATPEVLEEAHIRTGGLPAKVIMLIFGFGATPINLLSYDGKMFLNNGFHRVYALRKAGITHIPVVVQKITNPTIEMPKVYNNLTLDQILTADRLPVIQDFFDDDLVIDLKIKSKRKAVKVSWEVEDMIIPM